MKGDIEIMGVVLMFFFMILLLFAIAPTVTQNQFTRTLIQQQSESIEQFEAYGKTAPIIQNKTLINSLERQTYNPSSSREQSINNTLQNYLGSNYRVRMSSKSTQRNVLDLSSGSGAFKYSQIYIASPKKEKFHLTIGVID